MTGSAGITGVIVQYIAGIDPNLEAQPPEEVECLFFAYLGIPAVILMVPMYFIWKYPLSRKRMSMIRAELEARRSSLSS